MPPTMSGPALPGAVDAEGDATAASGAAGVPGAACAAARDVVMRHVVDSDSAPAERSSAHVRFLELRTGRTLKPFIGVLSLHRFPRPASLPGALPGAAPDKVRCS